MEQLRESSKAIANFFLSVYGGAARWFDSLPTPIKIAVYVTISGLLYQAAGDLKEIESVFANPYGKIVIVGAINIVEWAAVDVSTKVKTIG